METVKNHLNIRNTANVYTEIEKAFQRIEEYVKFNDYQINVVKLDKTKVLDALNDASLRKRKVLRRYMYRIEKHPTLDTVNKFLHFLFKTILKSDVRVKVTKSEKEQLIIAKRKEFKAALKIMLEKKQEYLNEKQDFYKIKLAKKQSI